MNRSNIQGKGTTVHTRTVASRCSCSAFCSERTPSKRMKGTQLRVHVHSSTKKGERGRGRQEFLVHNTNTRNQNNEREALLTALTWPSEPRSAEHARQLQRRKNEEAATDEGTKSNKLGQPRSEMNATADPRRK